MSSRAPSAARGDLINVGEALDSSTALPGRSGVQRDGPSQGHHGRQLRPCLHQPHGGHVHPRGGVGLAHEHTHASHAFLSTVVTTEDCCGWGGGREGPPCCHVTSLELAVASALLKCPLPLERSHVLLFPDWLPHPSTRSPTWKSSPLG